MRDSRARRVKPPLRARRPLLVAAAKHDHTLTHYHTHTQAIQRESNATARHTAVTTMTLDWQRHWSSQRRRQSAAAEANICAPGRAALVVPLSSTAESIAMSEIAGLGDCLKSNQSVSGRTETCSAPSLQLSVRPPWRLVLRFLRPRICDWRRSACAADPFQSMQFRL